MTPEHQNGLFEAKIDRLEAEIKRLKAVRDAADLLVNECECGIRSPSLVLLARLESVLAMEHKDRAALEGNP